jgi:DNA mismatch repair protein MutS
VFATHLHQLNDIKEIQDLHNVNSYHLKVHYDSETETGILVYDRNLLPGSGDPIYGLEVAKAMQLDSAFIEKANDIRKTLMNINPELLTTKKSRYNQDVYMHKCLICEGKAEHSHHIDFQCTADENNFIDHYHKNIDANIVPLCRPCHTKVHNKVNGKQYFIKGYVETSDGRRLDYREE